MQPREGQVYVAEDQPRGRGVRTLMSGGPSGNQQLTATTGVVLIVLLAVLGVTIVRIGQLIWLHLFLGLLLLGPVALKMASTGYRFVRYYTRNPAYLGKGPPKLIMRAIAPLVVLSTVVVFATGVLLLLDGPRHNRVTLLSLHKVSFIVWLVFTGLHVLGHLPRLGLLVRGVGAQSPLRGMPPPGVAGRWLALIGAVVGGLVLALVLIPQFGAWTAHGALAHHHRG